jgi:low temperature requirement protein LtrA
LASGQPRTTKHVAKTWTFGQRKSLTADARICSSAQRQEDDRGHRMSTAGSARSTATEGGDSYEQRVTPLELFFDLVFAFALTQVTGFLADHLAWGGMLQDAALLAVLWWAWVGYSWLTNAVPAEEVIPARLVILTAMATMLVASLAVPDAFGEYGMLSSA